MLTLVELASGQALNLATFLILARLLVPEDFGIVALASVLISIPQVLISQGFSEAIIQRQMLDDDHVSTAFWSNLTFSIAFFLLAQLFAGLIAYLFGYPELEPILRVVSVSFIFYGLTSIPGAIFRRNLHFATFVLRTVVACLVGGIAGIVMALNGYGVWALVGNTLVNGVVSVSVIWLRNPWRPKLRFSKSAFHDIFSFSANSMAAYFLQFTISKVDTVIVGAMLDARSLGYYYLVQKLLNVAEMGTVAPFSVVANPVLSKASGDPARFNKIFHFIVWITGACWMPAVAGLGAIAPALPRLFGEQWAGAIPLLQVISLTSVTFPLLIHADKALFSSGQPHIMVRQSLARAVCLLLFLIPAAHFSIVAVGWALVAMTLVSIAIYVRALRKYTKINTAEMFLQYIPIVISGIIMVAVVKGLEFVVPATLLGAVLQIVAGIVVYATVLFLTTRREKIMELLSTARGALQGN